MAAHRAQVSAQVVPGLIFSELMLTPVSCEVVSRSLPDGGRSPRESVTHTSLGAGLETRDQSRGRRSRGPVQGSAGWREMITMQVIINALTPNITRVSQTRWLTESRMLTPIKMRTYSAGPTRRVRASGSALGRRAGRP